MMRAGSHERRRGSRVRNLPPGGASDFEFNIHRLPRPMRRPARALRAFLHDLAGAGSPAGVYEAACWALVHHAGYRMAWIGLAERDPGHTVRPVASAGVTEGYLESAHITWGDEKRGRGPTGTAIRTRLPIVMQNALTDPSFAPWSVDAMRRGFAASAAVPLLTPRGLCLGALSVYAAEADSFSRQELEVLTRLAGEIVHAIKAYDTVS